MLLDAGAAMGDAGRLWRSSAAAGLVFPVVRPGCAQRQGDRGRGAQAALPGSACLAWRSRAQRRPAETLETRSQAGSVTANGRRNLTIEDWARCCRLPRLAHRRSRRLASRRISRTCRCRSQCAAWLRSQGGSRRALSNLRAPCWQSYAQRCALPHHLRIHHRRCPSSLVALLPSFPRPPAIHSFLLRRLRHCLHSLTCLSRRGPRLVYSYHPAPLYDAAARMLAAST